ncbi:MAG: hypothetical protein ACFE91_01385 [Promethearchaeota archaeon]
MAICKNYEKSENHPKLNANEKLIMISKKVNISYPDLNFMPQLIFNRDMLSRLFEFQLSIKIVKQIEKIVRNEVQSLY